MKNLTMLVFISTTIFNNNLNKSDSTIPMWLRSFIVNLENDSYYEGSVMYRYYWNNNSWFHLEIPSESCVFCQVINYKGEFIKWPDNLFLEYTKERSQETLVWKHTAGPWIKR